MTTRRLRRLAILLTTLTVAGSIAAATPAYAVDDCLGSPDIGDIQRSMPEPDLRTSDLQVSMFITYPEWYPPDYCSGVTAIVQKTDGSSRQVVEFDGRDGTATPPATAVTGRFTVPLATGAGDWIITEVAHGGETLAVAVRFRIFRATTATLEQPATVTSPAKSTLTGVVHQYTATGQRVAGAGRVVRLFGAGAISGNLRLLGTGRADAQGRYRFQLTISAPSDFRVDVDPTTTHAVAQSETLRARLLAQLSPLTASNRAYVGVWWRVSGRVFPTAVFTYLRLYDGVTWSWTQSFGPPAADGTFARYWKPTTTGTYGLMVDVSGSGPDNLPIQRYVGPVVVTARPTTLTGTAGATNATVIRPGTKMSTFGRLSAMYTTGATGPFASRQVLVQTRPRGRIAIPYSTVATATTTSTGYYYTNWTARQDVDVRVAFLSPYQSVGSAFRYVRAVDVG